jgi:8-oxo-dGTP pyrophosphatase MutT (NUDIX family)
MKARPVTKADPLSKVIAALKGPGMPSSDYDLNRDVALPPGRKLRPAGVLIPIICEGSQARIILTKRSSALKHHPGQIAFPGGKQDACDTDITATALREASEEIGLEPGNVRVLGQMPTHETVTSFVVTPVVARVLRPFNPRPEKGEVDEVFEVPLDHLLVVSNYHIQARRWQGHLRYYYTIPYGPYYIWGATARILRSLADAVGQG